MPNQNIINISNLQHSFQMGKNHFPVLKGVSLEIAQGDYVALLGKSGSGKSTLLNLIGGLMKPTSGEISLFGTDITKLNENQITEFRKGKVGFIFQSYNLIPTQTTFENVELPLIFFGMCPKERAARVEEVLEIVGLKDHKSHLPGELSGGQQQRVSIARALVTNPEIVLADEPTGNLDSQTEAEVMEFMKRLNRQKKITFIIVTHDEQVSESTDRTIYLKDGIIVSDTRKNHPKEVAPASYA